MGVLNRGILGGFRGKVGPVVGSSWKGIDVMKSKPLSVANPRTTGQVNQRNKFSGVVALGSALLVAIVKPLWDRFAQAQSGFNAFISTNIDNFADDGSISDFANMVISSGKLAVASFLDLVSHQTNGSAEVQWSNDGGFPTDELYLTFINENTGEVNGIATGVTRDAEVWTGNSGINSSVSDEIRVYAAFRRADGTEVSNTETDTFTQD